MNDEFQSYKAWPTIKQMVDFSIKNNRHIKLNRNKIRFTQREVTANARCGKEAFINMVVSRMRASQH